MPTYTFRLLDDSGGVADDLGLRLADTKAAYGYARDVALELMDHREATTRSWRLDVYENGAEKVFEILFAGIDETLNHLKPDNRKLVEMTAMRRRLLQNTLYAAGPCCALTRQALPRGGSRSEDNTRLELTNFASRFVIATGRTS